MPYAPVVVLALGFRREDVHHDLAGFGFLAPRRESLRILGCLFPSSMFPGRAPKDHVALAAFAGGTMDRAILDLDDDQIRRFMLDDLDRALGLKAPPLVAHLRRWERAIPQYELGHGRFVSLAESLEQTHPGLHIGGNVLGGISVPDCIRKGAELAERIGVR
jgi:oxygen-dependent protoporphyrinogen oxidase